MLIIACIHNNKDNDNLCVMYRGHAPLELFLEYHMRNIQHDNCCALYTAYTTL